MEYTYTLGDNLEKPLKYSYTIYQGKEFIYCWYLNRKNMLSTIERDVGTCKLNCCTTRNITFRESTEVSESKIFTKVALHEIMQALLTREPIADGVRRQLDGFVKTFEVRKRLYPAYSLRFKPEDETSYHDITLYVTFACVCALAFDLYQDFRYLNLLLKINDTVISQWERDPALEEKENQQLAAYALRMELKFVMEVCRKKGIDLWEIKHEDT